MCSDSLWYYPGVSYSFFFFFFYHSFIYLSGWTVVHWRQLALLCPLAPRPWPHALACVCRYNTAQVAPSDDDWPFLRCFLTSGGETIKHLWGAPSVLQLNLWTLFFQLMRDKLQQEEQRERQQQQNAALQYMQHRMAGPPAPTPAISTPQHYQNMQVPIEVLKVGVSLTDLVIKWKPIFKKIKSRSVVSNREYSWLPFWESLAKKNVVGQHESCKTRMLRDRTARDEANMVSDRSWQVTFCLIP